MFRLPVKSRMIHKNSWSRLKSSSSFIRSTFIEYFTEKHGHKHIKSSSVVPLCDPTVPFVNAGMNQFKGVFLGNVDAPCPRAVNSQKCVRVGGKHNDLDVVGTDGHHHTFFEMLGNWSFGDYYKKEACQMAWDLLLGPYRLKPENLVVTYFSGDVILGLLEDRECRDIWKQIGVPSNCLKEMGAADNFWEMGATGPCGPCTEIHHMNPDGTLTEIWNIVFIQCNRQDDGKVKALRRQHVDTGMGLERTAALLQGVPTNYDTDLFQPIIKSIEKNSNGVQSYGGRFDNNASLDIAYRRLADHARMISVCLADGVFPATSVNLKQIMRKSFKISTEVFQNPNLLSHLYDEVVTSLGSTYPELIHKEKEAKLILQHEMEAYKKLKSSLVKKWKDLMKQYPEVESLEDVETTGFPQGYKEFKEVMSKQKSTVIPGELVFKLHDTHGFQQDIIERIAELNNLEIDKKGFWKLLSQHKSRHKTAFKEQSNNKGAMFEKAIENLTKNGVTSTNDQHKYNYDIVDNIIAFKPLTTKLVAILNEEGEWIDFLEPSAIKNYYLVTKDTNFYCEEGGQAADTGKIEITKDIIFKVNSVFKIRNFVFHKGTFTVNNSESEYVNCESEVKLEIDSERRLQIMKNHTAVHLLNAAVRQVLPNSVVCQIGSSVTDTGLSLNLSVYGEKLSQKIILESQELIRKSIKANAQIDTRVIDSIQLSAESSVLTVPGETYPETGLRLVQAQTPLLSKELCCGTHVASTGFIEEFCVTLVKGAGSNTPTIHALTGHRAEQARELFCRAEKLQAVIDLADSDRRMSEITNIKSQLAALCGSSGAPYGEYADCLALLNKLQKRTDGDNQIELRSIAQREVTDTLHEALSHGRRFLVHFVRCSYLLPGSSVTQVLRECAAVRARAPVMLVGCGGGFVSAVCTLPREVVTETFTAERWMRCILPVFNAQLTAVEEGDSPLTHAQMTATKVSLINCEQLVQDAMRVAIKFAQSHVKEVPHTEGGHRETESG